MPRLCHCGPRADTSDRAIHPTVRQYLPGLRPAAAVETLEWMPAQGRHDRNKSHPRLSGGPTHRDLEMTACYKIPAFAGMTVKVSHPRAPLIHPRESGDLTKASSLRPPRRNLFPHKWTSYVLALLLLLPFTVFSTDTQQSAFDYDSALAQSQAAIGRQLANHRFTTAKGNTLELDSLRGKPLVVSMIYTSCHHICPMTTQHLARVVDKARATLGDDSFEVALIGFDTTVDNPQAMRFFAARQGIGGSGFHLLSADAATIAALSQDLGFQFFASSSGFDHLIQASVIDADGKVYRQVYGQVFETPLLIDPLIELVLGRPAPEQSLLDSLVARVKLFCTTYDPVRDGYYYDYSLFLGILIGAVIILATATFIARELRKH